MRVACIGLGVMGTPMAAQLLAAGIDVSGFDPRREAVEALEAKGGSGADSVMDAVAGADAVLLSLPGPAEVTNVVEQVLATDDAPRLVIDASTNSPEVVRDLHERCAMRGITFVDAPVSGGVMKAETGELAVMVGASDDGFAAASHVLDVIGGEVIHVGESSAGTIAKLVNNQIFLSASVLVQEAYVAAKAMGLEPAAVDAVIAASSGGPYTRLAPLLLGRRFDDVLFRLDIAAKDVALAVEAAAAAGASTPVAAAAATVYDEAVEGGLGDRVFHATLMELEARAQVELDPLKRPRRSS